jgi:hypothetical protein
MSATEPFREGGNVLRAACSAAGSKLEGGSDVLEEAKLEVEFDHAPGRVGVRVRGMKAVGTSGSTDNC